MGECWQNTKCRKNCERLTKIDSSSYKQCNCVGVKTWKDIGLLKISNSPLGLSNCIEGKTLCQFLI